MNVVGRLRSSREIGGTYRGIRMTIQLDDKLARLVEELARSSGVPPSDLVREAVEEFMARRNATDAVGESDFIFDVAADIAAQVPDAEWASLPHDLARRFDHYHYGHPRED